MTSLVFWCAVSGVLLFFLMTTTLEAHRKNARLRTIKNKLEKDVSELQKRTHNLESKKKALEEDPAYIERYLRDEHGMINPGEKILKEEK